MSKTDASDRSKLFPYNRNNSLGGIICGELIVAALIVWAALQSSQAPQVAGSGPLFLFIIPPYSLLFTLIPLYCLFLVVRGFFRLAKYMRTDPAHKIEYRHALLLGICVTLAAVCIVGIIIIPLLS